MAEWRHQMDMSARGKHSAHFQHYLQGVLDMLEHCVAFDPGEQGVGEGQDFGVGSHVHTGHRKEIEIDIARHVPSGSPQIEIPPAQGEIPRLAGVHDEECRRFKGAPQAVSPMPGLARAVTVQEANGIHPIECTVTLE
jgi:hypothetical protein